MEEKDLEKEIQDKGLTAPRITPADIWPLMYYELRSKLAAA